MGQKPLAKVNDELDKIFSNIDDSYGYTLEPIKDYMKLSSEFITKMTGKPTDESNKAIRGYIKDNKLFVNPLVRFNQRDIKGNRSVEISTLTEYQAYIKESGSILAPSYTAYFNKNQMPSLHAKFIDVNVAKRSVYKKAMFKHKMAGDMEKFASNNVLQKSMKVFNNSLSGAYASGGTVLNNATAHYTLTSITRCVSGIGNALSESIISGNRHYKDPDTTINNMVTIVSNSDMKSIEKTINEYKLYLPTPEETMESLKKSFSKYWRDMDKEIVIFRYLHKLSAMERAAIVYTNDLYSIREYNPEFMRTLIDDMVEYTVRDIPENKCDVIINNTKEWVYVFAIHILSDRLKGITKDKFTHDDKKHVASIIMNLSVKFLKYRNLINTFFITNTFPVSIAFIKNMVREAIVLSDTDSTCASYSSYVDWYFGKPDFSAKSIGVMAVVMTLVSQSVAHYIKLFSANLNVGKEDFHILEMKNEFFWDVFVNTNVSKHYYANVKINEGNVYDVDLLDSLELKGVSLISPNAYEPVRNIIRNMMTSIMATVGKGEKLSIEYYLDMVLDAEKLILDKLSAGSPDVFKLEKIKPAKSYKLGPDKSPYFHYNLWQEVFSEQYGSAPDPTYMAVKLPTTLKSRNDFRTYLESVDDEIFVNKFKKLMSENGKDTVGTFRVPLIIVYANGIPKELLGVIDRNRVVKDSCNALYMVLETLGYYLPNGLILSDIM